MEIASLHMPEARKEMNSLVRLVSEGEKRLHLALDFMSLFSLPVLNNDLQNRVGVQREGRPRCPRVSSLGSFWTLVFHSAQPGGASV